MTKYELLAPVGNFEMLHTAIQAGATAIYFGIKGFNMREGARNFQTRDLTKIKKICDQNKVKAYLTLNTVIYDSELKKTEALIKKAKGKVDAIICWDMSIITLCKKHKIPFHISTQASISNTQAAKFYKSLGAERVVLARELNLKQIKKISKIIPVECFAHGAMCVAISGRCFMSQYTHGLSANKGKCAHPCRRSWTITDDAGNQLNLQNSKVMSAKDLCTLPFIDKMKKAGIISFKIEGRNRSPEYIRTVVSEYKKALDKNLTKEEIKKGIQNLEKVYNRGFSSGFYIRPPTADDFSKTENGEQTEKKEFVGRVTKYWPKPKVCSVKIFAGKLNINDEVYILSKNNAIKRIKVKSIKFEDKNVRSAKKGQEVGIDFGIKANKGDDIYLIKKIR